MSKAQTEVAAKQNTAVALAGQFEEDAGSGFENADSNAYAIPFLSILQSMSPQCKKSDGEYIKGAEEGMFYNSVSQVFFDGSIGLTVVPCYYKRSFIRWAPRGNGGGFKGEFTPSQVSGGTLNLTEIKGTTFIDMPQGADPFDKDGKPAFDFLADTRTHYVLVVDKDGGYQPAVISLASSQIKKSRNWMSKMNGIKLQRADGSHYTPAMFSHEYRITTVPESNDKGSWFGLKVETLGVVASAELYQAAKAFRDAVSSGEVKEAMPHAEVDRTGENAAADGTF